MKRLILFIAGLMICTSVSQAVWQDGFITAGEYAYGAIWTNYCPPLIVEGGGADVIEVRDYGRLEVRYTSTPITNNSGIWDIALGHNAHLDYFGGMTEEITIGNSATASLYGGRIDAITSMQYVGWLGGRYWGEPHVSIYCQPGWSWISSGQNKVGITGLWQDNTPFTIEFVDRTSYGYPPTWMNINVVEIPEPISLALLAFSGLLERFIRLL